MLAGHASTSTPSLNDSMYGFPSPPLSMSGNEDIPYSGYISQQMGMPVASAAPPHPTPPPLQQPSPAGVRKDEYISYYFKYVRELQYVFAGDSLTNILLPVSVRRMLRCFHRVPLRLRACTSFPARWDQNALLRTIMRRTFAVNVTT